MNKFLVWLNKSLNARLRYVLFLPLFLSLVGVLLGVIGIMTDGDVDSSELYDLITSESCVQILILGALACVLSIKTKPDEPTKPEDAEPAASHEPLDASEPPLPAKKSAKPQRFRRLK